MTAYPQHHSNLNFLFYLFQIKSINIKAEGKFEILKTILHFIQLTLFNSLN